jgi:hypothetical protein
MIRRLSLIVAAVATTAAAQWLNYPAPGVPRLPDGRPNLSAPTPRTPDGKSDLSGIWEREGAGQVAITASIQPEDVILTPEGEALRGQRKSSYLCLPESLPQRTAALPFKILTLRGMVVILYEIQTTYRQIFTDGRELPKDPNPTWTGYSVGKWDGDTLVVDTTGFNDAESILPERRPHSDALHIVERFRRRDFGNLEIQFTIDDPKIYAKPWNFKAEYHLLPDTELLEYICNENEKDLKHLPDK